ncbi:MAG TPA: hypothetical protein GXX28_06095 [Firmicutes bacterium]|nr:hypothetical protein [Bacillota bacterium]
MITASTAGTYHPRWPVATNADPPTVQELATMQEVPSVLRCLADPRVRRALELVAREYLRATSLNGPFASAHEGYAVLLEEVDELKAEVWKSPRKRDPEAMLKEAVHAATMGLRFVVDVCLGEEVRRP